MCRRAYVVTEDIRLFIIFIFVRSLGYAVLVNFSPPPPKKNNFSKKKNANISTSVWYAVHVTFTHSPIRSKLCLHYMDNTSEQFHIFSTPSLALMFFFYSGPH